jgi:hypothetical protein
MNDVTVGGGQGFCDDITCALLYKNVTVRGGGQKLLKTESFIDDTWFQFILVLVDSQEKFKFHINIQKNFIQLI